MGIDKAKLLYEGQSFLERLLHELLSFEEVLLSAAGSVGSEKFKGFGRRVLSDIYPNIGPIGGLHAALSVCESDALFAVACDMPLLKKSLHKYLCAKIEDFDAVVAVSSDGNTHPLCAVYKKSMASVLEKQILNGNYSVKEALTKMHVCFVPIFKAGISDSAMININTPGEYAALINGQKIIKEVTELVAPIQETGVMDSGPFYHGTKAVLKPGELLTPGFSSNYGERQQANYIYLTATMDAAVWGAELAVGGDTGRIYLVEPTGVIEDDPNLTDKKFPGNPTRSYRTRQPLRVIGEVLDWEGHSPEVLQNMRDRLNKLKRLGIEAIND